MPPRAPAPLLGVSTAALNEPADFSELLQYEPDLIEIYNRTSTDVAQLRALAREHAIELALHTPTPYDRAKPLRRYCPTGPDSGEAGEALRLVTETVQHGASIGALHVVVHYPTPCGPFTQDALDTFGPAFLDALDALVERYGVPILLENMSTHPLLRSPEHYATVLAAHPKLGFCLDVGHAHLMAPATDPEAYARVLGPRIDSLHVYNTTPARYGTHGHELATRDQLPGDGFLDLAKTIRSIVTTSAPRVLVLEHSRPPTPAAARACGRWVRSLLDVSTSKTPTIGEHHGG